VSVVAPEFTTGFDAVFTAAGIDVLRNPPRAPRANAYAERWVRNVRTECLDWILIFNQNHLRTTLDTYVAHYNGRRPHRGLSLDVPAPPLPDGRAGDLDADSAIERIDLLGGLIHDYRRAA
jgi:transposase InsO family protein